MHHNFVFCEGAVDTGMRGIHMGFLYNFISTKHVLYVVCN